MLLLTFPQQQSAGEEEQQAAPAAGGVAKEPRPPLASLAGAGLSYAVSLSQLRQHPTCILNFVAELLAEQKSAANAGAVAAAASAPPAAAARPLLLCHEVKECSFREFAPVFRVLTGQYLSPVQVVASARVLDFFGISPGALLVSSVSAENSAAVLEAATRRRRPAAPRREGRCLCPCSTRAPPRGLSLCWSKAPLRRLPVLGAGRTTSQWLPLAQLFLLRLRGWASAGGAAPCAAAVSRPRSAARSALTAAKPAACSTSPRTVRCASPPPAARRPPVQRAPSAAEGAAPGKRRRMAAAMATRNPARVVMQAIVEDFSLLDGEAYSSELDRRLDEEWDYGSGGGELYGGSLQDIAKARLARQQDARARAAAHGAEQLLQSAGGAAVPPIAAAPAAPPPAPQQPFFSADEAVVCCSSIERTRVVAEAAKQLGLPYASFRVVLVEGARSATYGGEAMCKEPAGAPTTHHLSFPLSSKESASPSAAACAPPGA